MKKKATQLILKNPIFWLVIGGIAALVMAVFLIASIVSTTQSVASEAQIYEKIVPPQIYVKNLENAISSDYGPRVHPVTGQQQSFHTGIDIATPIGTPVSSSFDGIVRIVSYPTRSDAASTQNAGIYVVVESTDPQIGMSSRYLHMSDAYVTPGQSVSKGEIIGISGNTGRSTGPHLHYEMIPGGGEAIDPKPYIMMMSTLTDAASKEAFKVLNKIKWSGNEPDNPDMPFYESKKMLYISGVYMETPAPAFSEQGVVHILGLKEGGTHYLGNFGPGMEEPGEVTPPETPVTVPTEIGDLSNPFFIKYAAAAQFEERRSGVPASIILAQAALESGYGKRSICNNMFGIKANSGYKGPSCTTTTHEEVGGVMVPTTAKFRSYASPEASFADHSIFLLTNKRYRTALSKENPYEFANELQRAGYATDSQYANKLKSIIRSQNLAALDMNRGIDPATGQPFLDVEFVGGGGIGGGNGLVDSITITFGIRQYYGQPAAEETTCTDFLNGSTYTCYKEIINPDTGNPIINLVNYNRMVNSVYGGNTYAPVISIKDVPNAISVTVNSTGEDSLTVSNIQYIKGRY